MRHMWVQTNGLDLQIREISLGCLNKLSMVTNMEMLDLTLTLAPCSLELCTSRKLGLAYQILSSLHEETTSNLPDCISRGKISPFRKQNVFLTWLTIVVKAVFDYGMKV